MIDFTVVCQAVIRNEQPYSFVIETSIILLYQKRYENKGSVVLDVDDFDHC